MIGIKKFLRNILKEALKGNFLFMFLTLLIHLYAISFCGNAWNAVTGTTGIIFSVTYLRWLNWKY